MKFSLEASKRTTAKICLTKSGKSYQNLILSQIVHPHPIELFVCQSTYIVVIMARPVF